MIPEVSPEQVRRITQNVLERPEFREATGNIWTQFLSDFFRWFSRLGTWSQSNPELAKLVIITLTVLLLGLLAHLAYKVMHEFISVHKGPSTYRLEKPAAALEGVAENWRDAIKLARTALESGDLYRATWITHRVLLTVLDRMELLKFARWKTNKDYLAECRPNDAVGDLFARLSSVYERIIYAHGGIDREEVGSLLAQVEVVANRTSR